MKPKKSLGQNFLINPKVAERIAREAGISKKDTILEIGPGTGNLTKHLLERAKMVVAVEKDDKLFADLQEKFSKEIKIGSLVLLNEDILNLNSRKMVLSFSNGLAEGETRRTEDLKKTPKPFFFSFKIVANIPYNITGALLKKFLSAENQPESMTLMVQKEVAERIVARDGKESLLSISVKAYGEPKILFKVSRGNFYPTPNVDSAVISIKNISRKIFTSPRPSPYKGKGIDEELFWQIVKTGFAHKRKKLSSNLKTLGGQLDPETLKTLGNKRAEELTLDDWTNLTSKFKK